MGCCSISPTHDGLRIDLNDRSKQIIDPMKREREHNYRRYDQEVKNEQNKPQLVTVLGRNSSISPLRNTSPISIGTRINTIENATYWQPRPLKQNRGSVSPLNISRMLNETHNYNHQMMQSKFQYSQTNIQQAQSNRSHSALNSSRGSYNMKYMQASPLSISPMQTRNSQVRQQPIFVVNDFNCQSNQSKGPIISKDFNDPKLWNTITAEINQYTSTKNKDKIKITLNGDKCAEFFQSNELMNQLTPQLANQGITISHQNIQFVSNQSGQKEMQVELSLHKQPQLHANSYELEQIPQNIQEFTLQQTQESQHSSLHSSRNTKLNESKKNSKGICKSVTADNLSLNQCKILNNQIDELNNSKEEREMKESNKKLSPRYSSQSQYEYKKSSSRLSTNNNSRIDLGNNQCEANSISTNNTPNNQQNSSFTLQKQQEITEVLNDVSNQQQPQPTLFNYLQQEYSCEQQQIKQFMESQENNLRNIQTLESQKHSSINKTKLSNMRPDHCDQSSKLSDIFADEEFQLKNDTFANEINSQLFKLNDENRSSIAFTESIRKCQELKKYLQNKINIEQNSKILEIQDDSLKISRTSFKESKSRKANQILQEISDMLQNSSLAYSSNNNVLKHNSSNKKSKQSSFSKNNNNNGNNENTGGCSTFSSNSDTSKKDNGNINQLLNKLDKLNESYKRLNNQIENEIQNSKNSSLASFQQDRI